MSTFAPAHQLTREDRVKGALVSNALQRGRRDAIVARGELVDSLLEVFEAAQISTATLATVVDLTRRVLTADLPAPETPLEALRLMECARIAHTIYRLETGQSTANTASITVGDDALRARLAELTGRLADVPADAPSAPSDISQRDTNTPSAASPAPRADTPTDLPSAPPT